MASTQGVGKRMASTQGVGERMASTQGVGERMASTQGVGERMASTQGVGERIASTYGIGVASTAMLSTPHSSDPLRILKQKRNNSKVLNTRDVQKVSIG